MPINVLDLDDGLGVLIRADGDVSAKEFYDAIGQHLSKPDERLKKYLYSVSDYTEVDKFEVNLSYIAKIAKRSVEIAKVNPDVVVITIVSKDFLFGIVKIWAGLAKLSGWNIKIFKQREEAYQWLKKQMSEKYKEIELTYK